MRKASLTILWPAVFERSIEAANLARTTFAEALSARRSEKPPSSKVLPREMGGGLTFTAQGSAHAFAQEDRSALRRFDGSLTLWP